MITNADITIYNHKYNKETRLDDWNKTIIQGVHFYVDNKVALDENGVKSADIFKIRIPSNSFCEKTYLPEDEYTSVSDVSSYWTLQDGDYVVRGKCDMDIAKPADLKKIHKQCCKVVSWSDNRFGSTPHWRIGGE